MPRNARCVEPGVAYHVTQRGCNRQRVFFSPVDYRTYLGLLREEAADAGVRLLCYCLMTNHVHLLVVPERADSLAVLFRRVHGRYAQYLNARLRRSGHLWQCRYYSCPVSGKYLPCVARYIEQNPVRALMVNSPEQYRWSSAPAHLARGKDESQLLDMAFWGEFGGAEAWAQMHGLPDDPGQARLLRRCTYSGRPFGEDEFLKAFETQFQRTWRRWGAAKSAAAG